MKTIKLLNLQTSLYEEREVEEGFVDGIVMRGKSGNKWNKAVVKVDSNANIVLAFYSGQRGNGNGNRYNQDIAWE